MAGLPMVDNCMAGYNSCMFAYGQVSDRCWHFGILGYDEARHEIPVMRDPTLCTFLTVRESSAS